MHFGLLSSNTDPHPHEHRLRLDSGYGFRVECSTNTTVRPRECLDRVLGYYDGRAYRYAHDEPEAYATGERYFPDGMAAPTFYVPTDRRLEAKIRDKFAHLKALDAEVDPGSGEG